MGGFLLLADARPVATVPFKWTPGQIEVAVAVNGTPATFLLDTGSEYSVVSSRLAAQLRLPLERRGARDFAGGVELKAGDVTLPDQRVMIMPFDTYYQRGRAIDGLLGYDVFSRYTVRIRFDDKDLTFWEPSSFTPPAAAVTVPIGFAGRLPIVSTSLELEGSRTLSARLMVDTGASQAVILRYPFSAEHALLNPEGRASTAPSLASGERKLLDIPVTRLTLSKWSFDRPSVRAFAEPIGSGGATESDGLIGNTLLSRFTLYVDYSRQRLLLEPLRRSRRSPADRESGRSR